MSDLLFFWAVEINENYKLMVAAHRCAINTTGDLFFMISSDNTPEGEYPVLVVPHGQYRCFYSLVSEADKEGFRKASHVTGVEK